jgi:chorismate mutase-like protein
MEDLKALRDAIDSLDGRLLELLNERARLAQAIGRIKERNGRPVYSPERAEQLIRALAARSSGPLGEPAIRAIYGEVMSASLALEKDTVIACSGREGGAAHFAARQQFGSSVRYAFYPQSSDLFAAVASGSADCGVIPFVSGGPDAACAALLARGGVFLSTEVVVGKSGGNERFFVLGTVLNSPSGDDVTAFLLEGGAFPEESLTRALESLGLTLLRASRPNGEGGSLFLEVSGHAADDSPARLIPLLAREGGVCHLCGSYPRHRATVPCSDLP